MPRRPFAEPGGTFRLAVILVALAAAAVALAVVVSVSRSSERSEAKARYGYPPAVEAIRYGASRAEVRRLLGEPSRRAAECWHYDDLAAQTTRYRICFDARGRVVLKAVD